MSDHEDFKAEIAHARAVMEPWVRDHYQPMQLISTQDSETGDWIDDDAEIDLYAELHDEFGDRFGERLINEVAGELEAEEGDWGRPERAG
ncbi:hypothetical protein WG29040_05615 [Pseudomonas sp. PAMC 29040]|uniref:hypothetical protein n=1 Tax=Pseudomonas sp. PAMC 29040 TaxID=2498450 RepID=UPI000F9232A9|nr:hypothetical protein [Pseudomonas sp. PAMC 29040]RUT39796.1 hypothetical protein WG29040_05615 [Pseudomonas sp. PAMC 29040]